MPGKRIADHQLLKYKQHRNQFSQVVAAAKTGISERSARRIEDADHLPSQRPERNWRTRPDPLEAVWDSEVVPLLQTDARLNAVTLLEELQRRYSGQWDRGVRAAHPATPCPSMACQVRRRTRGLLRPGAPARSSMPVGLHRAR